MLNKLLDEMDGHLNTSKWAKMTKTSQDFVSRGGRSTSYSLVG
ncbi:MAG: hypothetical protein RIE53_00225 [Rhodothermales bacterium]